MFSRFIKFNYNPKILLGTFAFNASLSIYCDNKYGKTICRGTTISESCTGTSHVFFGNSYITEYGTDFTKLFFK